MKIANLLLKLMALSSFLKGKMYANFEVLQNPETITFTGPVDCSAENENVSDNITFEVIRRGDSSTGKGFVLTTTIGDGSENVKIEAVLKGFDTADFTAYKTKEPVTVPSLSEIQEAVEA